MKQSDGRAILVFSGGATKEGRIRELGLNFGVESGVKGRTEGRGYFVSLCIVLIVGAGVNVGEVR